MRKLPQEIIAQVPYLRIKHSGMFVMLVEHKQFVDVEYFQQTCHCLEVIFEGEISTHAKRRSHTVVQKELHFRKAGTYRLNTSPDFKGLFFFIEKHFIHDFLEQHIKTYTKEAFSEPNAPFIFKSSDHIASLVKRTAEAVNAQEDYASCIVKLLLHQILLEILSKDRSKTFVSFLRYLISDENVDLEYFMETHFTSKIGLVKLASISGRSLSAFKSDFKQTFGTAPGRWLLSRRLEHAHLLLNSGHERVSDIAYMCGFENAAHFSRTFSAKYGCAPSSLSKRI